MRVFIFISILFLLYVYADKERVIDGASARMRRHQHSEGESDDVDHQAILGSKASASEFDDLSPEESKRRLKILANKMDINKDGFVDRSELTDWISHSMKTLDDEEADERMKEMDTDNDNRVSWEEYLEDSLPEQDLSKLDPDDKKLMDEDKMYFTVADINGDGFLQLDELRAFLNPENYPHMHSTLVEVTMSEKDENKDGAIDLKEYLGNMADQSTSEWHKIEKSRFEEEYDINKDGVLTGEEVRMWLIPDSKKVAEQEANHLMEIADHNKDGKLSFDEIVEEYNTFVGSEVTNYGEDLHKITHTEL